MPLPAVKSAFFIIFLLILSIFVISLFTINFYDSNSFLNFIENKIINIVESKNAINYYKNREKYIVLNFNENVPSRTFLDLLYYLRDSQSECIIIDQNLDVLKDKLSLDEINKILKENIFFSVLTLNNSKTVNYYFKDIKYDSSIIKLAAPLNNSVPFLFSNFNDIDYKIENRLDFSIKNTGFIFNQKLFDKNNVDILIKINANYILSSPYQIYFKLKNWDINKIKYNYVAFNYYTNKIFLDQKGRAGYLHNIKIDREPSIDNFSEWEEAFNARLKTLEKLKEIGLFKSDFSDLELYKDEKFIIDNIYNYADIPEKNANDILTSAKNDAAIWKGFKKANYEKLKNKTIFITSNNDTKWIKNYIYQLEIIQNSINLKRAPLEIIILFSIILLILFSLLTYKTGNNIVSLITTILFLILLLSIYFTVRIFLFTDFPFITIFTTILYGFILGLIFKKHSNYVWNKEISIIFKNSISEKLNNDIANIWKYKNWDFLTKKNLCTFLYVDTSKFVEKEINKNDIESIGIKQSEIESIIKNNYGIRNNFNPLEMLAYFGNPPMIKDHAQKAIKTAMEIGKVQVNIAGEQIKLIQAIHSKEEWFNFIKKKRQKIYTYFGNSIIILSAMAKYADKFGIDIIISENVYKLCSSIIPVRMLDRVQISGVKGSIRLFELIDEEKYQNNKELFNYFHAGLKFYEDRKWKEAGSYFMQCLKIKKDDKISQVYLDRCRKNINIKNTEEWDSIFVIE